MPDITELHVRMQHADKVLNPNGTLNFWNHIGAPLDVKRLDKTTFQFETETGIPVGFFKALSKQFPEDEIKVIVMYEANPYYDFNSYKNGEQVCHKEYTYDSDTEKWLDNDGHEPTEDF